jgi:hypothetical protein
MATVVFKSYPTMDYMLNNPGGMVGRYIFMKGVQIMMAAKRQVGVSTGRLMQSIHVRHLRDSRGQFVRVGSDVSYAAIHHEGARPHIIVANRAQALRFSSGGRIVYTRKVNHPGTRPNRYLSDNLYIAVL